MKALATLHAPAYPVPAGRTRRGVKLMWFGAVMLLAYRILLMATLPLADTTEARYGEIARLTLTHGFWLMPHLDATTPFFAKPPLSTWAAAASMALFGVNEFAARLPSLLATLLTAWTAMAFARACRIRQAWLVLPVLATCPLLFISAGAVMTDAIQLCIVTAALYFAWRAIAPEDALRPRERRVWRLAFWTMVGIGALCKGLADWALIGLPLIAYAIVERRPFALLRQLFDWQGIALMLLICVPWYLAAEHAYPGFLDYFIIGEHFSRFLVPGWKGDRYGIAQMRPLGTIWLFWFLGILPWLGVFLLQLARLVRRGMTHSDPLERFLWCATLAPLVFFTFAHNIIWTYGLTAIVPFAVLVARWLDQGSSNLRQGVAVGMLALGIGAVACYPLIAATANRNSERDLVHAFHQHQTTPEASLLYQIPPPVSAQFYTQEKLRIDTTQSSRPIGEHLSVVDNTQIGQRQVYFQGAQHSLVGE